MTIERIYQKRWRTKDGRSDITKDSNSPIYTGELAKYDISMEIEDIIAIRDLLDAIIEEEGEE